MFPEPAYVDLRDVELQRCARVVVETCLGLKRGESFLIVGDTHQSLRLQVAFMSAAFAAGASPALLISPSAEMLAEEPPTVVAEAMKAATAVLVATTRSLTHTTAMQEARQAGARVISAPALQEPTFLQATDVDYEDLSRRAHALGRVLRDGKVWRLTSESGSDLRGEFGYETQVTDGYCREPGDFDQLTAGVAGRSPIEATVEGRIVVDAHRGGLLGLIEEQVVFEVQAGTVTRIQGSREAARLQQMLDGFHDPGMYNIAEIGTGANPKAKFTGYPMDDRRVIGAVHIGLGDNHRFFGGQVTARSHFDMAVLDHTLSVDDQDIIVNGKLQL
ncbi:MAG: hypothetical protein IT318_27310 [Anaerolineales bacterium]|nr:hypothetical protein [Anaerolineales bacterium]